MPCRVEETPAEIAAARRAREDRAVAEAIAPFKERNDALTHENDQLRELVLKLYEDFPETRKYITGNLYDTIVAHQVEHRQEDLRRLEKHFTASLFKNIRVLSDGQVNVSRLNNIKEIVDKLRLVMSADPSNPLEEQLGFDPDSY